MWMRSLCVVALVVAPCLAQADIGDRFFAKIQKDALRDLERGKPAQQIEAAGQLGVAFAPQVTPVLANLLAHPDPVIRLAAAEKLWEFAAQQADAFAAAEPALRQALADADAAVAMNAAGALAAMDVPARDLADARRRVLDDGRARGYVAFLAARGLVGIDPAPPLLPYLLEYYFNVIEEEARGGSDDNVEIAEKALTALCNTQDRGLIAPLLAALDETPPATAFLLERLAPFKPKPDGWTARLLRYTASPYPDIRDSAWDLLGDELDPGSLDLWAPVATRALADPEQREDALAALADAAGRTSHGLGDVAALARNSAAGEEAQVRAIEVLADAADTSDSDGVASVHAAARKQWESVCSPLLGTRPVDVWFKACRSNHHYIIADDRERAVKLGEWLSANPNADAKIEFLQNIESLWDKGVGAIDATRAAMAHADPAVAKAAEAAMNRIRPAWREADARGARPAATAPAAGQIALEKARGADGAGLFAAISSGQLARVKALVKASNVNLPVHYPQVEGTPPTPINVAVNYCGIPQAEAGLKAIVEYLISLGADPDVSTHDGSNLLDRAKYSCSPEVMTALTR
jgi:hypothetical protein